ncbi:MAG: hypothetical protein ACI9CF_001865, partial [Candidatus Omnitrophota bacterium]
MTTPKKSTSKSILNDEQRYCSPGDTVH